MPNQSTADEAYFDRNQIALAFARLALARGWAAGIGIDPDEPDWPVLYVDTPCGQLSWHLPKGAVRIDDWPRYAGKWDGHDVEEKRRRLAKLISGEPGML